MFAGLVEVLFSNDLLSVQMKVAFDERETGMSRAWPWPRTLESSRTVYRNSLTTGLTFVELWSIRWTTNFLIICACAKISLSQSGEQCFRVPGEQDAKEDIFGRNGRKYSKMQKTAQYGASSFVLRTKYHQGYQTRRMRWTEHVAHVREKRMHTGFWYGSQEERRRSLGLGVRKKSVFQWTLK
jgi:hypothetical protein